MPILSISYGTAAVAFACFSIILLTVWRKRNFAPLLSVTTGISLLWALSVSLIPFNLNIAPFSELFEVLKNVAWIYFLYRLLQPLRQKQQSEMAQQKQLFLIAVASLLIAASVGLPLYKLYQVNFGKDLYIIGYLCWSLIGLIWIEWLFRQTKQEQRWAVKFLCLGCAVIFGYDFYMYSHALLYKQINYEIWQTRGIINTLAVPLIAIAIARNPPWSAELFVSKRSAVHSLTISGAAIYLLLVAAAGYYVKNFGGRWGTTFLALIIVAALIFILLAYFSGDVRARLKVYFQKNFSSYKYDYRDEWLQFVNTLSHPEQQGHWQQRAIRAIAEVVDSPGGMIWLRQHDSHYELQGQWHIKAREYNMASSHLHSTDSLIQFLAQTQWVIEKQEFNSFPERYATLELPAFCQEIPDWWLLIPLFNNNQLLGFVVLQEPKLSKTINWEDHDLLKTCARHLAHYAALSQTTAALVEARQFEAFNQMSAFLVHDLKNVVAQLSLIVSNAQYHKHNPAFVDDAIDTVDNAVQKMERILSQLKRQQSDKTILTRVTAQQLFEQLQKQFSLSPIPLHFNGDTELCFSTHQESLLTVMGHLLQNAIDVSPADQSVQIEIQQQPNQIKITITDFGCGMDAQFIKERLFKPFDSTKGKAGMGIGVYQSRALIRQLGGELLVHSVVDQGTTFTILLSNPTTP